jgi:hypothetical protein
VQLGAFAAGTRDSITIGHSTLPNITLRGTQINSTGNLNHTGDATFNGTITPNRIHFLKNPFTPTDPTVNLGAIRLTPGNQTLSYTVYDMAADIQDQSYMSQTVNTALQSATTTIGATYNDFNGFLKLENINGVATLETNVDTTITADLTVTGGVLTAPAQLPAGTLTEAASIVVDFATITGTFQTVSRTTTDDIALTLNNRVGGRYVKILVTNTSGADRTISYAGISTAAADAGRRPATLANTQRYLFDLFCVGTGQPLLLNTSGIV